MNGRPGDTGADAGDSRAEDVARIFRRYVLAGTSQYIRAGFEALSLLQLYSSTSAYRLGNHAQAEERKHKAVIALLLVQIKIMSSTRKFYESLTRVNGPKVSSCIRSSKPLRRLAISRFNIFRSFFSPPADRVGLYHIERCSTPPAVACTGKESLNSHGPS
jgi:hypothetical protein